MHMTPGMDPQRGLWNCAISTLVQRSSGDKLLGSDLYQKLRLKAKNSFWSRDGPSRVTRNGSSLPSYIEEVSQVAWSKITHCWRCLVSCLSPIGTKDSRVEGQIHDLCGHVVWRV
ncbi:hypothetical protein TNIN_206301 [Trichonephila inaurata madagascariensis]|uniref:Uncharacterized protein n=1 Tax=Trichonephila inaurata madagascariensis TaxID=2747483 RepID=A0A8X6MJU7_9ARAC|nr:hypothetical protein TNIN_206301 [Trichonephila inaurata madagascariensis]